MIDELAGAYGWSKAEILETVYIDEALELRKWIKKREAENYLEFLRIQRASNVGGEGLQRLTVRYNRQAMEPINYRPPQEKKDSGGVRRLKVYAGGKIADT